MSVGLALGWGVVTTQTMRHAVLHVCGFGMGWNYNMDHVTCCPVCLWCWGWGEVGLQHRPCDVLSCMSVRLGLGGVIT